MCKILVFTNMSKIKNVDKAINTIAESMSARERDGFGYAIQGESGVFGERSTSPVDFVSQFDKELLDLPFIQSNYNRFGTKSKAIGSGIFHGRTSTNHKTLVNTHPIVKHDWTLIHNGVVSNHGPDYNMITTNDTEHLVHYIANGGVSAIERNLTGYYALAAFSPDNKLHVMRDSIAGLYIAWVKSIDSYVIATTKDLLLEVCGALKLQTSVVSAVSDNVHLIFNKNKVEASNKINPRGRTAVESRWSSKSLGYELESSNVVPLTSVESQGEDESEIMFLTEVNTYADASYTFLDYRGNEVKLSEFRELSDDEKLSCTVIRGDGTVVSPYNYQEERIYMG